MLTLARVAVASLVIVSATSLLRATTVPPTDNTAPPYLGSYGAGLSYGGMTHQDAMVKWLYRSQMFVHTGCGYQNWYAIEGESGELSAMSKWLANNPGGTINYMLCMLPGYQYTPMAGTSMAAGANGDYDAHFKTLATALVNRGLANNIIIRIGHEFNGNWYPWGVHNTTDAATYKTYFQKIVTAMRSIPGTQNLKFEWCGMDFVIPYTGFTINDAYPGDAYVDYIGADIYDACYATNTYPYGPGYTDAQRQQNAWYYLGQSTPVGLKSWCAFAAAHSKPFTIPEWGITSLTNGHGGNDNPYFIQQMYNFIQDPANNVYYHNYFDVNVSDGHHQLTQLPNGSATEFPNAAALFKKLFGIAPLPLDADIGTVGLAGSGGVVSVAGAGTGFVAGGTSDSFHFTSEAITGDYDLSVKIPTMTGTATAQSGLMLRQGTTANAPYGALFVSNGNCIFQSRVSTGGIAVQEASVGPVTLPIWLKLVRQGNGVVGYKSQDGLNWSFVGAQTIPMTAAANLGVAVSSGNTTALNTTAIDQVDKEEIETTLTGSITSAVVLDNVAAAGVTQLGTWTSTTTSPDFQGTDYLSDGNLNKGTCSVAFAPTLPTAGRYGVYARWPTSYKRANNTPLTVATPTGTTSLQVNQELGSYLWNYLGTYTFAAGATGSTTVSNTGTTAEVVADAVMYVPLPPTVLPLYTLFKDPFNNMAFTAQYGTIAGSVVGTDAGNAPYEGASQYKLAYTSGSVGYKFAFNTQNLTSATHLRIAQFGPLVNTTHTIGLRLGAADGTMGAYYTLTRKTTNQLIDIPMSALSAGMTLSQVNGIFLYPSAPTSGQSDTVYFDNIVFVKKY